MEQYRLVFKGEILPGHEPDEVRQKLLGMLRMGPEKAERVFSGRPIVIKKGLDADQAQRYRRKLASMGIGIRVEAQVTEPPPPPPPTVLVDAAEPMVEPAAAPAVEEMDCPECGHHQPKRTLCLNCGCDMPRVLAAREAQTEERHNGVTAAAAASIRIHDDQGRIEEAVAPRFIGADFGGRISRRSYLAGNALLGAVMVWAFLAVMRTQSLVALGIVGLIAFFFGVRLAVLRCHDFDWRGWWVLVMLVPYVGALFSLLLLFFPGSRESNTYGDRPASASWLGTLAALLVMGGSYFGAFMVFAGDIERYGAQMGDSGALFAPGGDEAERALANYDPSRDRIVMYSLTTCGYCDQKRAQFDALGVRYHEVFIDTDPDAKRSMWRKLRSAGWDQGGVGTPTLEVNGVMLPNNPSLLRMSAHFLGAS